MAEKHERQHEEKERVRERYKGADRDKVQMIPATVASEKLFDTSTPQRVCAYCRVSTDDVNQTSSFESQKSYYEKLISEYPNWTLVDIYADEGISGTSLNKRDEFNRMIGDCMDGKIDIILTKSVSRFARNTVDCIDTVRQLLRLKNPVRVFFETEHIDTMSSSSEITLTVLSAAAQEESRTKSAVMNHSIEYRFSIGLYLTPALLGYDYDKYSKTLSINEEEAKTVRLCFSMCLQGYTLQQIADELIRLGRKTKRGNDTWSSCTVLCVLRNERHCGAVLARKTFTPDFLTHKTKKNRGERNQYMTYDHHEPIVSREVFEAAQKMLSSRRFRMRGAFPNIRVIRQGALTGFVPINLRWRCYTAEELLQASLSTESYEASFLSSPSQEALSNFQVANAHYMFEDRYFPRMDITLNGLKFNSACVKKLNDCPHIEVLYHPRDALLVIRPCRKESEYSVKWTSTVKGKQYPNKITSAAFCQVLFDLHGWERNCKYEVKGICRQRGDEAILLFSLNEPRVIIPHNQSKQGIIAYPAEIVQDDAFTLSQQSILHRLNEIDYKKEWNISSQGELVKEVDSYLDISQIERLV